MKAMLPLFLISLPFLFLIGCSNAATNEAELEGRIENELGVKAIILDEPFDPFICH
jgi:hypothetical protein